LLTARPAAVSGTGEDQAGSGRFMRQPVPLAAQAPADRRLRSGVFALLDGVGLEWRRFPPRRY